jgi:hypothetical protein
MDHRRIRLIQTLGGEDNHDPLDLELTLNTAGRRREKRKRSVCSSGKEDSNGDDQEVKSSATGGLSLSLFLSPTRTSGGTDQCPRSQFG